MLEKILKELNPKMEELENHPLYAQIDSLEKLRLFMQRHVFAVFDFMSLAKSLQNEFAPVKAVWTPPKNKELARFMNEIILVEESDVTPNGEHMSHFEMYCMAMAEVKGDSDLVQKFVRVTEDRNIQAALDDVQVPESAWAFMHNTFSAIKEDQIHKTAAAFCFGREKIIPKMFEALLQKINIKKEEAPTFYYYLDRHIEVDSDSHGPLALKMLSILCGENETKWQEVKLSALNALEARIDFWNKVSDEIQANVL